LLNQRQQRFKPQGEEAAHVVGEAGVAPRQAEARAGIGPVGSAFTPAAQTENFCLRVKTASDHQIKITLHQCVDGASHGRGLVLTVTVHHHSHIPSGIQQSLFDRAGQARSPHAPD
jgi:D-alanyl-D-alanine carboxypeptidase